MTDDPGRHLDALCAAHELTNQPDATFRALDAAASASVGHILFTVLVHHPVLRRSERRYTNQPVAYPVGGHKPVTDTPWMDQVIRRGKPYIGRTREDIAAVFYDHELIASLGCESVLNFPVRWRAETRDNEPTAPGRMVRRVACANGAPSGAAGFAGADARGAAVGGP